MSTLSGSSESGKISSSEKGNSQSSVLMVVMATAFPLYRSISCSSPLKLSLTLHGDSTYPTGNGRVLTILAQKKANKTRRIILKEDVSELGKKGELLEVKPGFYRNFLLPLGKAQLVTPLLIKEMKIEEERIEAEKRRVKEEAEQLALLFRTVGAFKVKRKGGKGKQIFGTVTAQDLVDIIKAQLNRDVDRRIISLPEIRETGEYIAELKLHPEVTAQIRLNVYAN